MIYRHLINNIYPLSYIFVLLIISLGFLLFPFTSNAQYDSVDIAKTYIIAENTVSSGDIISFDRKTQQFRLSREQADENLFGIATSEPLLVLEVGEGGVPIVRTGEIPVNVTTINGAISAGDYVTSSSIPGKGQYAGSADTYIIGIALESFPGSGDVSPLDGADGTLSGSIRVLLSVGTQAQAVEVLEGGISASTGLTEATILNIIQYLLAAFIAVGSLFIAFKNFGPNIKDGIVSIGRNPLAKSSIQSMVILNVILIILVSGAGLFVSIAVLLLPI